MNSEKVEEIKKALEDNANYSEQTHLAYIEDYRVKLVAYADILTLINELESENEVLRKHNIGYHIANNYEAQNQLKQFAERLKESASQHYVSQNGVRISDITYSISGGTINKILKESIND